MCVTLFGEIAAVYLLQYFINDNYLIAKIRINDPVTKTRERRYRCIYNIKEQKQ